MRLTATRSSITSGGGAVLDPITQEDPSLDLQFAENKNLNNEVDGDNLITFSRASSATYVGADGLIKTTSVNLLPRSEEIDNSVWTKERTTVTSNAISAPDGSNTADLLVEDTGTGTHSCKQTESLTSGTSYVLSAHVKANSLDNLFLSIYDTSFSGKAATFDLTAGTSADATGSPTSHSIVSKGDGWYRVSMVFTAPSTSSHTIEIRLSKNGNWANRSYTGTGESLYVWGAQLEEGTTVTDYIPTTSTISGAPRFDHDPTTGESLGLLIEQARTNIIDNNHYHYNSIWTNAVPAGAYNNAGIAPDGTNTAFSTTNYGTATRGQHNYTVTADTNDYTFSIFIKSVGGQGQYVTYKTGFHQIDQDDIDQVAYDFATDTVGHGYSRQLYANGWVRIWKTYTNNNGNLFLTTQRNTTSLDMLFWGAQLEIGSHPSSLIITPTGANVTRAADVAKIVDADFAKTNLLEYSERFEEWDTLTSPNYEAVVTPNVIAAPDGTLTAYKFVGGSLARLFKKPTVADGNYVLSFYVKPVTTQTTVRTNVLGRTPSTNETIVEWNFNSVSANIIQGAGNAQIISVVDGWFRCSIQYSKTGGSVKLETRILDNNLASNISGVFVWGAQLEEGSVLTEYTPSVESFVSRASIATYVDDATGLIKTPPTNLYSYSEDFSQSQWVLYNATTSGNAGVAPDGISQATKLVNDSGLSGRITRIIQGQNPGETYTSSIHLKQVDSNWKYAFVWYNDGGGRGYVVEVDLEEGTSRFTLEDPQSRYSSGSHTLEDVGNGWYRVSITVTVAEAHNFQVRVFPSENPHTTGAYGTQSSPGDGTSGILIWGAQYQQDPAATPYIKTTSTIGGAARYENGELLLEEARTNFISPSTPVTSQGNATVTPNAATAPDGTNTATLVEPNGGAHSGVISTGSSLSKTAGVTRAHSFYYKPNGYNVVGFNYSGGNPDNYGEAYIDVTNPTSTYLRSTFTSVTATDVGSGWYRITALQVPATTGTSQYWSKKLVCRPNVPTTNDENFTHTSGSGGYFWGHQEEVGPYATSFIPTTTTAVTRAADVSTSALGVDSWYNQSEGSAFIDWHKSWKGSFTSYTPIFKTYNTGTNLAQITWGGQTNAASGSQIYYLATNSSGTNELSYISYDVNDAVHSDFKAAFALATNDAVVVQGGSIRGTDTSINVPTMEAGRFDAANFHIRRFSYFPTRLPDATLQDITS